MPWLADLVQSSESSLNALPLQCLCEFLLMKHRADGGGSGHPNKLRSIKLKVAGRLQDLLVGAEASAQSCFDVVQYFINRWSSPQLKERESAVYGFKTIVLHQRKYKGSVSSEDESTTTMVVDQEYGKKASKKEGEDKDTAMRRVAMSVGEQDDPDSYMWLHEKLSEFPFIDSVMPLILTALRQVCGNLTLLV